MKHVFVSPHPDDVALSCGGLVSALRGYGQDVAILTVFSGPGSLPRLTPYQRLALGFGSQEKAKSGDDEAVLSDLEAAGAADDESIPTPSDVMSIRRAEDSVFARSVGAQIAFVNLPDAVFRDYRGDSGLMGEPRADDPAPVEELRRALAALAPDRLYLPLAIGGHVDHRQTHRAGLALLAEATSPYAEAAAFYEDFPYSWWTKFEGIHQLDPATLSGLPQGARLAPEYVGMEASLQRKIDNLLAYESQMGRIFGGREAMAAAVRERAATVGSLGDTGPSERYWRVARD